jgi:hypothetical protein
LEVWGAEPAAFARVPSPGDMTYYIDPAKGDDANSGDRAEKPWKSTATLNTLQLAAGDRVELLPGRYDLSLQVRGEGTADKPVVIQFAPGEYDFFPAHALRRKLHISNTNDDPHAPKAIALAFEGVKHVRVAGGTPDGKQKSDVFVHGQMIQTFFDRVEDVQLDGMAFDYRRPTMSEYTAVEVTADHADIAVHRDATYAIKDGQLTWVGEGWQVGSRGELVQECIPEEARTWRCRNPFDGVSRVEEVAPFRLRVYYASSPGFIQGHTYQVRNGFRNCAGSFARNSKDIVWKNCAYYYMHGLGLVCQFCENITLDHCWMAPRRGSGRSNTAWADCFHLSGIKGIVSVDGCYFFGQHDDPINIHGTFLRIVEKQSGNKVRVRFMHSQTYGFAAYFQGDEVAVVRGASLRELSRNRVATAEMSGEKEMIITFEKPLADTLGDNDVLENISWNPQIVIRNCSAECSPTFGFVLKSRGPILVENCTFRGINMSPIALAQYVDAHWYESCTVHNAVIRNNRFLASKGTPVIVNPGNTMDEGPVNDNVRIENNYFGAFRGPAIIAKSVKGLTILNNRFATPKMPEIRMPWSVDVKIEGNQLIKPEIMP